MGLTSNSFQLSSAQIDQINNHFAQRQKAYLDADAEIGMV